MNLSELVQAENDSIHSFVARVAPLYLTGIVLDFGCGRMPYRRLVERPGVTYVGYDRPYFPASAGTDHSLPFGDEVLLKSWNGILCTQVIQFVPDAPGLLLQMADALGERKGALVLTYPTNWPEINDEDLHRFTYEGMERLLMESGFDVIEHEPRACVEFEDFSLSYGGGIVGQVV